METRTTQSLLMAGLLASASIGTVKAEEIKPLPSPAPVEAKAPAIDFEMMKRPIASPAIVEKKTARAKKQEDAAAPVPGAVTVSGLVDTYFSVNARAPRSAANGPAGNIPFPSGESINVDNTARFFDVNDREISLSLVELNVSRTPSKSFNFGLTGTFTFGDSARLFHATEPGGTSSWSFLHNLFITYNAKIAKHDVAIDFGKFASPFGLEVLESVNNDNYSRAFDFWYGVPFYHLGLRATTALNSVVTVQGGIVNGWNDAADSNNAKTVYAQFTLKPSPVFTQTISYIGGWKGPEHTECWLRRMAAAASQPICWTLPQSGKLVRRPSSPAGPLTDRRLEISKGSDN